MVGDRVRVGVGIGFSRVIVRFGIGLHNVRDRQWRCKDLEAKREPNTPNLHSPGQIIVSDIEESMSRSEPLSFLTITSCALFFPLLILLLILLLLFLSAFFSLCGSGEGSANASLFLLRGNHRLVSVSIHTYKCQC